jgi:hypothetical protein
MAIADFYFLRTVSMKITRKYRYHKRLGMWDRYYNKYYQFAPEPGLEPEAGLDPESEPGFNPDPEVSETAPKPEAKADETGK